MAFSQSLHKSQIPINCHLCDIEKNIKWKCLECELLMCDNCKIKRHPRIKNSINHKVIDIKDIGLLSEELDFTNIKCRDHPGQTCCFFCKSCNSLVCPTCESKVHKKHDLIEIRDAYNIKKDKLKTGQRKIETNKDEVLTKKGHLEKLKNSEYAKYTRVMRNIKNQEESLKQAVEKHIEKIRNEVDQDRKTVMQSIDADLDTISRSMQQSDEKNTEIEDLINSTNSAKFFHEVGRIENSIDVPAPKTKSTYKSIPDFVPGEIYQSNVGVLQSKNSPLELSVSLNINKQYQTELSHVSDIIPCLYDKSIFMNSNLDAQLMRGNYVGNNLRISSLNIKVYGMALTDDNDILLATGKSRIQQLSTNTGKITDTVYDISPLISTTVHVTSNNKVIIGAVNSEVQYKVIVMNTKGEYETVYGHNHHNQPMFNYPQSITSTDNGNIHVVDYYPGSDRGRVTVLGQGGGIINTYTGHTEINKDIPFKPTRIVTTPRDNVIVADMDIHTLHILDNNGQLLTCYKTKEIGILCPFSLAFTQKGQLLIGCTRPKGSTTKEAKIYEVNISEC
ncbi:Hypothetical predicted protein [Mytilus galloprovincialis]|uniref:B box-type domain-containing protein n=1 Tax=Mytilus galloprovincialis TaxID=29158 RepID=A0A8B6DNL8_MYTGA|nr:Hypothetical predicted protein [Mytilus galloprovincialis]